MSKEDLEPKLAELMNKIRGAIGDGAFAGFRKDFLASYQPTDEPTRLTQKQKWLEKRNLNQAD